MHEQKLREHELAFETYEAMKSLITLKPFEKMSLKLGLIKDYLEILAIKSASTY